MLNAMSQGNDGSMTTIHASSSSGAMLKLAAYAAQSPGAPDPGGHRAADRRGDPLRDPARLGRRRERGACPASGRSPTPTAGRSPRNEVWAPGPDRRAVPAVPVRAATMEELAAAGYRPGPWQAA